MLHWRPKSIYFHLLPILPPPYDEEQPQIDKPSAQSTFPSEEEVLKGAIPHLHPQDPSSICFGQGYPSSTLSIMTSLEMVQTGFDARPETKYKRTS